MATLASVAVLFAALCQPSIPKYYKVIQMEPYVGEGQKTSQTAASASQFWVVSYQIYKVTFQYEKLPGEYYSTFEMYLPATIAFDLRRRRGIHVDSCGGFHTG